MTVCEPRLRNRPLSVTRDRRGGARSSRHSFARALCTWSTSLVPVDPSQRVLGNLVCSCRWVVGLSRRGSHIKRTSRVCYTSPRCVLSTRTCTRATAQATHFLHPRTVNASPCAARVRTEALSRLSLLFCRSNAVAEPPTQGDRVRCDSKVARAGDGAQAGPRASSQVERRAG